MSRPIDRARIRRAITAQLSQRQMTLHEITDELDHLGPPNRIRTELLNLVGSGIVCARHTGTRLDTFETWERAMARVRANAAERGPRGRPRSSIRRGERMA